ncbi:TonB-dependent receptor [Xanthomonas vesicatoria]|uniref:Outer membrane receptor protein n=1 Tax=Xanthomonas vesicatoria ATCC 35937 TaxID=925775 RepID=F0BB07_9XANT|nr:TonB-dependent receptor [Xanthomonas vesicatoria]APP76524.1 TonB-dependent receptor [Xanthomonas vesicatoria ATCC 35937]EGD10426.1 outer membrane receptor protein [Xanthomonas vesicatoria ATCC 35937]KTF31404.1 TonB-dependent receptor [Xanthomonas vesicatoria]MCC8597161.1 TonB-dependent receptor [Xanthomonas vesicatoria]MCC8605538.1 TonB-dependent receptor [Xanthomonas vesicatoria]
MKIHILVAAVAAVLFAAEVRAQSSDSALTLGKVDVHQHGEGQLTAHQVLTSVDVLGADQIEDKNVSYSWELLGQMPGIQLTETRQGAESGKVSFRAFNGEGYLNAIKTLIDGIPSNVNSGNQRFIDMLFPLEISYIEVVRGTNDPRYGLHNIGGNINFGTRQGGNYTDARLTYGSFNTRDAQLAIGRERDGFAQNYFVGVQASDGYRDHDTSSKYALGGKWFYGTLDDGMRIGLTARVYHNQADEPGFMTAAEMQANRRSSDLRNRNDGDDRDMRQLGVHMDLKLAEDLFLGTKLYYNSYEDDRQVTFSDLPTGNAPRQRRIWDETQVGMLNTLTWRSSDILTLEGGLNYEHQDNGYRRERFSYAEPTNFSGTPARIQNDDRHTFDNWGAYVQAIYQPIEALKIVPAYRVDRFDGDTQLPGGVSAPLQRYGTIEQPKLSLVYAFTPTTNVYANWGRTFQVLTGSTAPAYLTAGQADVRPSTNTGMELGMKFTPFQGSQARIAVWQQDAANEVSNMPATGTTVTLGKTRRRGVDAQINAQLGDRWTLWASHAYQEAKIERDDRDASVSLVGREVAATPRYISNIGIEYRPTAALRLGLQGRAQGDYYLEERNVAGKYGGFATLDLTARYTINPAWSVDLQVRNATGREYAYAWYDSFFWTQAQPMFSPAAGRQLYLGLNMKL